MSNSANMRRLDPDDRANSACPVQLPFSEVCMHLGIADEVRIVQLERSRKRTVFARVWRPNGIGFDVVTPGEAGIYKDANGYYTYEAELELPESRKLWEVLKERESERETP